MKLKITILGAKGRTVFVSATKTPSECKIEAKEVPIVFWIYKSQLTTPKKPIEYTGQLKPEFNTSHYF